MNQQLIYLFGLSLILFSCSKEPGTSKENIWADTQKHRLEGEAHSLRLPNSFFRSSTYLLIDNLKSGEGLQANSYLKSYLQSLQFQDPDLDIFRDTTDYFSVLVIADTERIPLDRTSGGILAGQFQKDFDLLERTNPGLQVLKIEETINGTGNLTMLRYKYHIIPPVREHEYYQSLYFLTNSAKTYIVNEFSPVGWDISDYLWSLGT